MEEIVLKFIHLNNLQIKDYEISNDAFHELEEFIGVEFTNRIKDLMSDLVRIKIDDQFDSRTHLITCNSKVPSNNLSFGIGNRDTCTLGLPLFISIEYCKLRCKILWDMIPRTNNLIYPLFDEYGDGYSLICIDKNGRIWNYMPKIDNDFGSLLADDQDEFVNKLYIEYEN